MESHEPGFWYWDMVVLTIRDENTALFASPIGYSHGVGMTMEVVYY
jgi:hypothetical protein